MYFSNKILKSTNNLLQRMNTTTKYSENASKTRFKSEMTPSILINGNISLMNEDKFVKKLSKDELLKGNAILNLRKPNIAITFSKETGRIQKISPEESWWKVGDYIPTIQKALKSAEKNFNNKSIVKKELINLDGITDKGIKEAKSVGPSIEIPQKPKSSFEKFIEKLDNFFNF